MCHLSPVIFFSLFFILKKIDKLVELVGGGSVITGPNPSSFFPQKGNIPFCIQPCKALAEIFPSHENFSNNESRYPPSSLWNTWVFLLQCSEWSAQLFVTGVFLEGCSDSYSHPTHPVTSPLATTEGEASSFSVFQLAYFCWSFPPRCFAIPQNYFGNVRLARFRQGGRL